MLYSELNNVRISRALAEVILRDAIAIAETIGVSPFVLMNGTCRSSLIADARFSLMNRVKMYAWYCRTHRSYKLGYEKYDATERRYELVSINALCRLFGMPHATYIRARNRFEKKIAVA